MDRTDSITDKNRRRAIKKIAAGAGLLAGSMILPDRWSRPVIDFIFLPAHAATSGEVQPDAAPPPPAITACVMEIQNGTNQGDDTISFGVTSSVNPPTAGVPINLFFTATGGGADTLSMDIVTGATGIIAVGTTFTFVGGGYTRVTVVITSSVATGTSTCFADVPPVP